MFKGQNGITLVALVITIIVMLILAGVSISLALDPNNGLFGRAQDAANATEEGRKKEQNEINNILNTLNAIIEQYNIQVD